MERSEIRDRLCSGRCPATGCISVRDYDKFVQAYEDGKFNQIIVLRSAEEPGPSQVASNQADGT